MFIDNIQLKNFKCYKDITLELKQGVNIIYGVNATGKTALLEAIGAALGTFFTHLPEVEKRRLNKKEIRLERFNGMPYPEFQFPVCFTVNLNYDEKELCFQRCQNSFEGGFDEKDARDIFNISKDWARAVQNGEEKKLPLICYFSTARLFNERKKTEKAPIGRFRGYFNALNETNSRKHIEVWLKDTEIDVFNKQRHIQGFEDLRLNALKSLLLSVLNDMSTDGKRWDGIYYHETDTDTRLDSGLFLVDSDKQITPETHLSDGYRNLIWLVLEIGWRMIMLNPFLEDGAFQNTTGIVLIDEIDLHLHPKWQQKIARILREKFPKIQFVLTTHSPIVISSVQSNVIYLDSQKPITYTNAKGLPYPYVLDVLMGVKERLPHIQPLIDGYFQLINADKGKSGDALKLRTQLEEELLPEDPIFSGADALISFLEL